MSTQVRGDRGYIYNTIYHNIIIRSELTRTLYADITLTPHDHAAARTIGKEKKPEGARRNKEAAEVESEGLRNNNIKDSYPGKLA